MGKVKTARVLSFIGGIISSIVGTIYLIWAVISVIFQIDIIWVPFHWVSFGALSPGGGRIVSGVLGIIFGLLTLFVARPYITEGESLKTGAILCFIFGSISAGVIGGTLIIVAGILAIIAWSDQRKAVIAFCAYCGAQLLPKATFCPSCGKKVKK